MTCLRTLENSSRRRSFLKLFVFLVQREYSSGKKNASFNVGGIVLHNGITKDNDFAQEIDCIGAFK